MKFTTPGVTTPLGYSRVLVSSPEGGATSVNIVNIRGPYPARWPTSLPSLLQGGVGGGCERSEPIG